MLLCSVFMCLPHALTVSRFPADLYHVLCLLASGGISRVAKLLIAVATSSSSSSSSQISFVDAGSTVSEHDDYSNLGIHSVIQEKEGNVNSACTAMSFDNFSAHIALLRDAGSVTVINIESGSIYAQLVPDGAGVVDVRYSNAGKMLTLGRSPRGQIQVWDIRGGGRAGAGGYGKILSVRLPSAEYTCVTPHSTQDHYVYCGDSSGSVHEIDLRTASITHSFKAHGGPGIYAYCFAINNNMCNTVICSLVSGIVQGCQADGMPTLLTSSRDGSVTSTGLSRQAAQAADAGRSGAGHAGQFTLLREPATISDLDFDYESKLALMTSSVGGLWVSSIVRRGL
jgi:WD40 repeat protein